MLMGSIKRSIIILAMFSLSLLSRLIQGMDMDSNYHDRDSLDDFFQDYARNSLPAPRTGIFYNISLPAAGNFSGMEISMVRVRTGSFWRRGGNYSFFHYPTRILPTPNVKRLDIVISNLGNQSSYYFNVPNYTFVTPVIGFMVYGERNSSQNGTLPLSLSLSGDPILVHFSHLNVSDGKLVTLKCVTFGPNTTVELTNMTTPNVCITRDKGHFSIVRPAEPIAPSPSPSPSPSLAPSPAPATANTKGKSEEKLWKWWVVGFGVGVVGLLLIGFVIFTIIKFIRKKRIEKLERRSEKSVALETTWVGRSRMPSAPGIRTQPVLETDYFP